MRSTWGIILVLVFLLPACGTGNRLDDEIDGGGNYLPAVNEVDSGELTLTDGLFNGPDGQDLVLLENTSQSSIRLSHLTTVTSGQTHYDPDRDGDMDFVVLTIRPLSAQAAACTTAVDGSGALISPSRFDKVGGAGFEPVDATFSPGVTLTLGVSSSANKTVGQTVDLFKYEGNYQTSHVPSEDIGTGVGVWRYVQTVTLVEQDSYTVAAFDVADFGEYAVVTDVPHNQGDGEGV